MKNKNKYVYRLAAIKRKKNSRFKAAPQYYDLVVCKHSRHNKLFVVEKIGSYNKSQFYINVFRLVFWLQYNVSFNIKAWLIVTRFIRVINTLN